MFAALSWSSTDPCQTNADIGAIGFSNRKRLPYATAPLPPKVTPVDAQNIAAHQQ
jgi:hypothetical protein